MTGSKRELLSFLVVGTIGFSIDFCVLLGLFHLGGVGAYLSRLLSFSVALTVTWLLNRRFTFRVQNQDRIAAEYFSYATAQSIGAAINFAAYAVGIESYAVMAAYPVLAAAAGSVIAMTFNFFAMKFFVFRGMDQAQVGKARRDQ